MQFFCFAIQKCSQKSKFRPHNSEFISYNLREKVCMHFVFGCTITLNTKSSLSVIWSLQCKICLKFSPRPRYLLLSQLIIMTAKSCWYAKHARRLAINNTARTLWLSFGLNPHLLQISLSPNYTTFFCVCVCVCLSSLKTWNNVSHTEIHSHTFHTQAEWGAKYTNIVNTTNEIKPRGHSIITIYNFIDMDILRYAHNHKR